MNNLVIFFCVSFILSFFFLILFRRVCLRFNLCKKNKESPFIGGLCFSLVFVISYSLYNAASLVNLLPQIIWVLLFSFLLLVVEFIDDLKEFPLKIRVIIQIIFIFLFLLYGKKIQIYFLPSWINYLLSFLWIMGLTNAFNLLDIGDGLCGGVSLIASLAFFTVAIINGDLLMAGLFVTLSGAVFAFVLFNLPPARVFMGNSGSHFLGFLFATLSMYGDYATLKNPLPLILPLLILAFPIIDTIYLIISRIKKGIAPLRKSDDHIFLRMLSLGYNIKKSLLSIYLVNFLWGLSGIFIIFGFSPLFLITLVLAILFTLKIIIRSAPSH